jgi:F-type H+-transporting ATPase subunit g
MSFAVSRALVRQSRFAVRRAGMRNASTTSTSEAAGAAKEKAGDAASKVQSKASEGLTKVKSSADSAASSVSNAASNAASTVNSTASQAQGRVGRMMGAVQGKSFLFGCNWVGRSGDRGVARSGRAMRRNGAVGEVCAASRV